MWQLPLLFLFKKKETTEILATVKRSELTYLHSKLIFLTRDNSGEYLGIEYKQDKMYMYKTHKI